MLLIVKVYQLCFSLPFPVGCSSQILIPQQVYSLRNNKCTYCNLEGGLNV